MGLSILCSVSYIKSALQEANEGAGRPVGRIIYRTEE